MLVQADIDPIVNARTTWNTACIAHAAEGQPALATSESRNAARTGRRLRILPTAWTNYIALIELP